VAYRPFIPRDYKLFRPHNTARRPSRHWLWLGAIAVLALGGFLAWPGDEAPADDVAGASATRNQPLALPPADDRAPTGATMSSVADSGTGKPIPTDEPAASPVSHDWKTVTVRPGDTLASIFGRQGLGPVTVHHVVYLNDDTARLRDLKPGEQLKLDLDDDGNLAALQFELDEAHLVQVDRQEDTFASRVIDRPIETRIAQASGVIDDSLYAAAKQADLSDALTMELAHIFGWDIDFVYDIRAGDRFFLIYQELYRDGKKLRDGEVLAATFINRGENITAVRYDKGDGRAEYYTPDGHNMRKQFLRTPVDFRRISSRFNMNRLHPTLGYRRPHEGVDYAADRGTPIIATGDGRIKRASWYGGYGNCVIIEHAGRFETLYGHMSKYARGIKAGAHVHQGQVIGYVGMTGTATGPHVHYEFHVDGKVRDPLKVELPPAPSLAKSELPEFRQAAAPLVARLDILHAKTMLARLAR